MEKSQYKLSLEVLGRLDRSGILKNIVLVGSWCTLFYKDYFSDVDYRPVLKTRDMDLLVPQPAALKVKTDVAQLLKDLGFVVGFTGTEGYIRLEHPELIVEFLVPEKGRGTDKPYALPQLGLNAQSLRFLEFLAQNTMTVMAEGITVTLPHPVNFALHKLVVTGRRRIPEKQTKDKQAAVAVLNALIQKGQSALILETFEAMPRRWQGMIKKQLAEITDRSILEVLEG